MEQCRAKDEDEEWGPATCLSYQPFQICLAYIERSGSIYYVIRELYRF